MSGLPPEGMSSWSRVPSKIPAGHPDVPERIPEPRMPSQRRIFWWRVLGIAAVAVAGAVPLLPLGGVEPSGFQIVVRWTVVPLALFFGTVVFVAATYPYPERGRRVEEVRRATRRERREHVRAIRNGRPISSVRGSLVRFWIAESRAVPRFAGWQGLLGTVQLALSTVQSGFLTVIWLVFTALVLGVLVHAVWTVRTLVRWEQGP